MKNLTVLFLFVTLFGYAQTTSIDKDVNVTGITYSLDTVEGLEAIDWKNIKEVLEGNSEEEQIELTVAIRLKESKSNLKSSFTVRDKAKNLDRFITRAKKGVKALIKVSEKYKN